MRFKILVFGHCVVRWQPEVEGSGRYGGKDTVSCVVCRLAVIQGLQLIFVEKPGSAQQLLSEWGSGNGSAAFPMARKLIGSISMGLDLRPWQQFGLGLQNNY